MIKVWLGALGSGKTACAIREIYHDKSNRKFYTNITTKGLKNAIKIKPEHLIKKEVVGEKKKRDGTIETVYKLSLNQEYWVKQKKPLNIILDESSLLANSRRSMSKPNEILTRFIIMSRRFLSFDEAGYGSLIFIAQKERTLDINILELCSEIRFHILHFLLTCKDCDFVMANNSEREQIEKCRYCGSHRIRRHSLQVEIYKFNSWNKYIRFKEGWRGKWHFEHFFYWDISEVFKFYNTHQLEDMWGDYLNT